MRLFRVPLIDRFVLSELLQPFLFGLLFFVSIMLIDFLMDLINLIFSKGVPLRIVFLFFVYYLPPALVLCFPMALLLACLIGFSRMSGDSEMIALKAGGYSFFRIVFPALAFGGFITLLTFFFNEKVVPTASEKFAKLFRNEVSLKRPLPKVAENRFFDLGPNQKFYARKVIRKKGEMLGVILYEGQHNDFPRVIEAERARLSPTSCVFFNGRISRIDSSGGDRNYTYFREMNYPIDNFYVTPGSVPSQKTPQQMGIVDLYRHNRELETRGSPPKVLVTNWVEFWAKTSIPFACVIFVLLGTSLGTQTQRSGKSIGIGLSVIIIFVYYFFLALGKAFAAGNLVSPFFGAWLANFAVGSLGLFFAFRSRA